MSENENEVKELKTEHLASEVLKQQSDKSRAKNLGMVIIGILAGAILIAGAVERAHLVDKNYQNDCEWRKLFSDYDFVTQDGGGINNVNGGEQGDLNNGTTSENKEER